MLKLVFIREVSIERSLTRIDLFHHLGQTVIGLRPHDQINHRLARHDLGPLGLCHATRHPDLEVRILGAQRLVAAQLGINLFSGFFADVTRVEQDHIRILGRARLNVAFRPQRLSHALAVIDVHLAAIGLDVELFGISHCAHSGG